MIIWGVIRHAWYSSLFVWLFYVLGGDCSILLKLQTFKGPSNEGQNIDMANPGHSDDDKPYSACCKTTHSASAFNSGIWITRSAVSTSRWENRHSSNALRRSPSNEPKQSASNSGAQVHSQKRGAGISEISCHGNSLRNRMMWIIVRLTFTVYYSFYTCNRQPVLCGKRRPREIINNRNIIFNTCISQSQTFQKLVII